MKRTYTLFTKTETATNKGRIGCNFKAEADGQNTEADLFLNMTKLEAVEFDVGEAYEMTLTLKEPA